MRTLLKGLGMRFLQYVDEPNTDTSGYLARTAEGITVWVWRGTASRKAVLIDCDFPLIHPPGDPYRLHKGFWGGFIATQLLWNHANVTGYPLMIIGHSLGGALATIAGREVADHFPDLAVRTFGSPRAGDRAFTTLYDRLVPNTIRVVHDEDDIPCLAPSAFGFEHVSGLLHLMNDGKERGVARTFWDWITGATDRFIADLDGEGICDHFMARYQLTVALYEARQ